MRFIAHASSRVIVPIAVHGRRSHLRVILSECIGHYNTGRGHQGEGMGLRAQEDAPDVIAFPGPAARVQRRARLAGLINQSRQSHESPAQRW